MEMQYGTEEERTISKGSLPIAEQETTISYSREFTYAEVWTSDRTVMTKLDRLCKNFPENYQCTDIGKSLSGELISKTYRIKDKGLISFRSARTSRPPREYTEEELDALRERLAAAREKQKSARADG